jgi:tetratricopeptide (TPR) repeat protein
MADKAKLMKEAQKFLAKGNLDKAIEVWLQIAKAFPDGNTFNYIGDLYVKKGDKKAAIAEYHNAADKYTEEGFSLKALAIHKKVLNINPRDPGALIALGQLNEEKNIVTDAIKYYLAAADVLAKENRKDELIEVFDKVLSLAPTNLKLRVKVSELFSKEGFVPEAAKEYCNIANLYIERNEFAGAQEYLTKAIEIMPGSKDVLLALTDLAEKKGDMDQAAEYLKNAIERTGESTDILVRRARLLMNSGSMDEAVSEIQKAIELEPDNIDARKQLSELYQQMGDLDGAWQEAKQMVDSLITAERRDEAIEMLVAFKEQEPVDNRRKLITVYKMAGDEDNAFAELYGLHEIQVEQGHVDAAVTSLREALELKPGDSLVAERLQELEGQSAASVAPETEAAAAPEAPPQAAEAPPQEAGEEAPSVKTIEDALSEADVFMKYSLHGDARTLLEEMREKHPDSVDIHMRLKAVYREMGENEQAITECLELNSLLKGKGDEDAAAREMDEALEIDPSDPRLSAFAAPGAAPEAVGDISADLAEADFYEQQGLLKEASDTYRKVLSKSPGNEEVVAKLAAIEKELSGTGAPEAAPAPAAAPEARPFMGEEAESEGLFDFSSILGNDDEEGPAIDDMDEDVLGIFDEFKKGLAQEIADEDASTHYDLGIAYKEMGVVDDAIKEFQVSSRDPKFFSQSTTMIGICQMSVGRYDQAIEAFSAAIMKADPSNDTWWSLKYDLATAYEISGKKTEAFEIYRDVYNWDVTFREVEKKYKALKGSLGSDAPQAGTPDDDKPPKADGKKSRVSYI